MKSFAPLTTLLSTLLLCTPACGPTSPGSDGELGRDGGSARGPDSGVGDIADAMNCGAQQEEIALINLGDPPDLLIVLDRSGSMQLGVDLLNPFGESKWSIMNDALMAVTNLLENNINFGLMVFPTHDICGLSPGTEVSVGPNKAAPITSWMNSHSPDGNTPAHLSLEEALNVYSGMPVNPAGRYVLFATDGQPNCGGDPVVPDTASGQATIAAVTALASQGIPTFVVGFGLPFGFPGGTLEDAAQAGGVPNPNGSPYYYPATNEDELEDALLSIAGGIIPPTCSYELAEQPPNPSLVTVLADGVPVPKDVSHNNGWDYHPDASTITFFGQYCADIESAAISSVDFLFGCPGPEVD